MTRCEQKNNERIPAAGGEFVAPGGVAKFGAVENASLENRLEIRGLTTAGGAENGEFRNDLANVAGAQGGETDQLTKLPQPVLAAGRGRPKAVTPQLQEQLCLLLSVGLSRRQAAAYLGIDHTTLSHTAARDTEFSSDLKHAEEIAAGRPLLAIFGASRKNWRAAVWLVEHRRLHPPALTPEEKAERHKEALEDARRQGEVACALSDGAWGREPRSGKKRR